MRPLLLLTILFSLSLQVQAQNNLGFVNTDKVRYEFFDSAMNATEDFVKVAYLKKLTKTDTSYTEALYQFRGPQVYTKTYKDASKAALNGVSVYMNQYGNLDSAGYYKDNLRNGRWIFTSRKSYTTKLYNDGLETEIKTVNLDSLKGRPAVDSLEKYAEFPGGVEGWRNYLVKNFRYPQRAINLDKEGTVYITFMIDKDGTLLDPYISRSIELSIDEVSLGLIRKSPKWIPAVQHGRNVKCYFSQPVSFRLQ